jgi:type IV pilus assembly protein PilB
LATEAALTGHLVLSTIHTNSAAATIQRLVNMGVEPFLIASASKMIISQRLGKRICPHCKKERELTEFERKRVNEFLAPVFDKKDLEVAKFYEGIGCEKCSFTGYK